MVIFVVAWTEWEQHEVIMVSVLCKVIPLLWWIVALFQVGAITWQGLPQCTQAALQARHLTWQEMCLGANAKTKNKGKHSRPLQLCCPAHFFSMWCWLSLCPKGKNSSTFKLHLNKLGQGLEAKVLAEGTLYQQWNGPLDQGEVSPGAQPSLICLHSLHLALTAPPT